jgi:hypothetical protein
MRNSQEAVVCRAATRAMSKLLVVAGTRRSPVPLINVWFVSVFIRDVRVAGPALCIRISRKHEHLRHRDQRPLSLLQWNGAVGVWHLHPPASASPEALNVVGRGHVDPCGGAPRRGQHLQLRERPRRPTTAALYTSSRIQQLLAFVARTETEHEAIHLTCAKDQLLSDPAAAVLGRELDLDYLPSASTGCPIPMVPICACLGLSFTEIGSVKNLGCSHGAMG